MSGGVQKKEGPKLFKGGCPKNTLQNTIFVKLIDHFGNIVRISRINDNYCQNQY